MRVLGVTAPDGSGNPGAEKAIFSCLKKKTEGSSFCGAEKMLFERGVVANSWIRL